jgi:predicted RNA-binding Zn ribbon-like protein
VGQAVEPDSSGTGLPQRIGGSPCLDFANTLEPRVGADRREYLNGYSDLVRWARDAAILNGDRERRLLEAAARRATAAGAAVAAAIELREAIYGVFEAVAQRRVPAVADLAVLEQAYAEATRHARIVPEGAGLSWTWREDDEALERVLWPVARSAVELAVSGRLDRVKQCPVPDGGCGWLFLDTTKNGIRRWCSMQGCGGRAKARRQYARRQAAGIP